MFLPKVGKPIVPIPYGNNAKSADLAGGTTTISMDGGSSVAIKGSTFSKVLEMRAAIKKASHPAP
ncbi:TPA: hypothetical protein ACGU4V_004599 [Vibrio vulnificus]